METILAILEIIIYIGFVGIFYCIYQLIRNEKVYKIVGKWIDDGDPRYYKYSYDDIMTPSKRNLYGLIFPNEKQFK